MAMRVLLQFAKPTMQLANPIWDSDGRPAAGRGSYLRDGMVRMLRKMDFQSVVVEDTEDVPEWETVRDLEQEILELEKRFAREESSTPVDMIRQAINRHLTNRAEQLANDPALAAMVDPKASGAPDTPTPPEDDTP